MKKYFLSPVVKLRQDLRYWPSTLLIPIMTIQLVVFLILTLFANQINGQHHDRLSFMGYGSSSTQPFGGMVMDNRYSPPRITKQNNKINFYVSAGSCSDSTGNLLFYTNGIEIRNAARNKMQNGDSINAISEFWSQYKVDGFATFTPMYSVPFPGHPNQYFLFHQGLRFGTFPNGKTSIEFPLMYTLIDMNQNGGLGKVLSKNQMMVGDSAISTVMTKHGNGRDWWLITGVQSDPVHLVFLITDQGIQGPFEQGDGPAFPGGESFGLSTISPDGSTYVRVTERTGLRIFDFDRCNGQLSNLRVIPYEKGFKVLSAIFAPDNRYLYLNYYDFVAVIDMQAPDPALTLDTIAYYDGFATPLPFSTGFFANQLHEDGKIYYATTNGTLALHVIHQPQLPGLSANVQQHGITLPYYNAETICRFPNYRLGKWSGSPCDTLPFAGPGEKAFRHTPYQAQHEQDTHTWRVLSPLRGNGQPANEEPDVRMMFLERGRKKE